MGSLAGALMVSEANFNREQRVELRSNYVTMRARNARERVCV